MSEVSVVAGNMIKYGGSFVKSLGNILFHADPINAQKIEAAWPEYWNKYKTMGMKQMEDSQEEEKEENGLSSQEGIKKILIEFPDKIRGEAEHIYGMELKKGEMLSINKTIEFDLKRSIKAEKEQVEVEVKATAKEKNVEGYKPKFETVSKDKYTNDFQREAALNTRLINHKEYTANNAAIDHLDKDIGTAKIQLSFLKRTHESAKYLSLMGAD